MKERKIERQEKDRVSERLVMQVRAKISREMTA